MEIDRSELFREAIYGDGNIEYINYKNGKQHQILNVGVVDDWFITMCNREIKTEEIGKKFYLTAFESQKQYQCKRCFNGNK